MENEIRFPFLGIVFKHVGEGISIGGFEIKYYGMVIAQMKGILERSLEIFQKAR